MPETNFRALCAELVAAWDSYGYADAGDATDRMSEAVKDAKAELAQPGFCDLHREMVAESAARRARTELVKPEPVAPTDEGISQWSEGVCGDGAAILRDGVMMPIEEVVASLNRAERLARWGRPPIPSTEKNQ